MRIQLYLQVNKKLVDEVTALLHRLGQGAGLIDLRRSRANCYNVTRTARLHHQRLTSDCGSRFSVSMIVNKADGVKLLEGHLNYPCMLSLVFTCTLVSLSAPDCRLEVTQAPATPPPRRCRHGFTLTCPSFSSGACPPRTLPICFSRGKGWVARNPYYLDRRGSRDQEEVTMPSREEKQAVAGELTLSSSLVLISYFKRAVSVFPTLPCLPEV